MEHNYYMIIIFHDCKFVSNFIEHPFSNMIQQQNIFKLLSIEMYIIILIKRH